MPNPMFGSYKQNQSDKDMAKDRQVPNPEEPHNVGGTGYVWVAPEDAKDAPSFMGPDGRPHPMPPVGQEAAAGRNNAYRGVEMHGVLPDQFTTEFSQPRLEYPQPVEFDESLTGYHNMYVEPVPVYIVNPDPAKCFIKWSGRQFPLADVSIRVVNRRICRKTLQITNLDSTNTIYVDGSPNGAMSTFSYPLAPGEELRLENTQDEVWASCAPTKTATLGIIEEYEVEADQSEDQPNATQPATMHSGY